MTAAILSSPTSSFTMAAGVGPCDRDKSSIVGLWHQTVPTYSPAILPPPLPDVTSLPLGDQRPMSMVAQAAHQQRMAIRDAAKPESPPFEMNPISPLPANNRALSDRRDAKLFIFLCVAAIIIIAIFGHFTTAAIIGIVIASLLLVAGIRRLIRLYKDPSINFSEFAKDKQGENVFGKDILLILSAKPEADRAGALLVGKYSTLSPLHHQQDYVVVCIEIESAQDIANAIRQMVRQANRIHGLMIRCHGYPEKLQLGSERSLDRGLYDAPSIIVCLADALPLLDADAGILLYCCSTGRRMKKKIDRLGSACIAETFAKIAQGREVAASAEDFCAELFNLRIRGNAEREARKRAGMSTSPFDAHFFQNASNFKDDAIKGEDVTVIFNPTRARPQSSITRPPLTGIPEALVSA